MSESVTAGERAAINLAGVKASTIRRGEELATPGALQPARRHLVQLRILPDAEHGLKHRQSVRLHIGSNQVTAQVLMGQRRLRRPSRVCRGEMRCSDCRRIRPAVRVAATVAGSDDRRGKHSVRRRWLPAID